MSLGPGDLLPLSSLTGRGAVQASDLFPTLPPGALVLESQTAAAIQAFVLNSVTSYGADPTGVVDSTSAIQAAINSGLPIYFPPGTYTVSSTLLVTTAASHGQVLRGAGPVAINGTGANKTVIKPTSAVSVVFLIDGTPFGSYVQGFAIENLSIDMSAMSDVSTNIAIQQIQAFDGYYSNIKIINDGANKRAWQFVTGAYTTSLRNTRGNIIESLGSSTANGVTTLTFDNHDGDQLTTNCTNGITVIGGSWQGTGTTKFKFRNGCDFWLKTDVEGSGVFLDVDSTVNGLYSRCELQGFSGTYMNGSPAPSSMLFDQQVNYNTYPFGMTVGRFNFNNQGVATYSSILSGGALANYYLEIGRTGLDLLLGAAAAANDFVPGTVAGDAVVGSWQTGSNLFLAAGTIPMAKITTSGFNTFGTGQLEAGSVLLTPSVDGPNLFVVKTAAGVGLEVTTTNAAPSSSVKSFGNGLKLLGYFDNFASQSWKIDSATGIVQAGAQLYPGGGTTSAPVLTSAAGILAGNGNPSGSIGNNGDFYLRGDGTHGSTNLIWHKEGGSWVAII